MSVPATRFPILPNAANGKPTRHRYVRSRRILIDVPIYSVADENECGEAEWKKEWALAHYFQCEKTLSERIWGCDSLPEAQ